MKEDIISIVWMFSNVVEYMQECEKANSLHEHIDIFDEALKLISVVNGSLFCSGCLEGLAFEENLAGKSEDELKTVLANIFVWYELIQNVLNDRIMASNNIEEGFQKIIDSATLCTKESLVSIAKNNLMKLPGDIFPAYEAYYQCFHYLWGTLDSKAGRFDLIENRVTVLKERYDDLVWLYNRLADNRSRLVLYYMLNNWLTFDFQSIVAMKEGNFADYFDLDLVECDENEVIADVGAYTGDSAEGYIKAFNNRFKRIYCYDIVPENISTIKEKFSGNEAVIIRECAVGSEEKTVKMKLDSWDTSVATVSDDQGLDTDVNMVTLDNDIQETITMIKMDIEGAEKDALKGCKRHILEEKPKLLICVYHNNTDIVDIPKQICELRDDYKLYLRSNGLQLGPSEIVLFAL